MDAIQFLKINQELSRNEQVKQYKQAVVIVKTPDSKGTGFNIAANGIIVTNYHVVEGEQSSMVKFPSGQSYSAKVVATYPQIDTALLQINEPDGDLPTLPLTDRPTIDNGTPVYVIGNPLFFSNIANKGEVLGATMLADWTDPVLMLKAPIYKGNSGSPVIDHDGNVLAVVFATTKVKVQGQTSKVGLAIPIHYFKDSISEL